MRLKQLLKVVKISTTLEKYDLVSIGAGLETADAAVSLATDAVTGFSYWVVFQKSLLIVLSSAHTEAEKKTKAIPNIFFIVQASF